MATLTTLDNDVESHISFSKVVVEETGTKGPEPPSAIEIQ